MAIDTNGAWSIAKVASLSRLLVISLAVASDHLLADHAAQGVLVVPFAANCHLAPFLRAFTRWDSAHFLNVAQHGWQHEWSHAFFPLYPLAMRAISRLLSFLSPPLCPQEQLVLAGVLISNVAFVVAACCLHGLGKKMLGDAQHARSAALLFCAAPASIFFSTLYSESLYAATTLGGLYLLECGQPWRASASLALATACRANGVLNALPMLYHGGHRLASLQLPGGHFGYTSGRVIGGRFRRGKKGATWAVSLGAAVGLIGRLGLVVAPYVIWQVAGYLRFCHGARPTHEPSPTPLEGLGGEPLRCLRG
jgi:hypothetical protein